MARQKELEELKELDKNSYNYYYENSHFTDREKEIFELRYKRGLTIIEISMLEDEKYKYVPTSPSTVNRILSRIRKKVVRTI